MIHTVKGFSVVNEAELDLLLLFFWILLLLLWSSGCWQFSGSPAFSKSNLYIWNVLVHILLKPTLPFFGTAILWDWNEIWPNPELWPLLSFPNLLAYWMQHFNSIILKNTNSAGISSPPLALFLVMLPKAHLTSCSRMSGYRWVTTLLWLSQLLTLFFCTILLCFLAISS